MDVTLLPSSVPLPGREAPRAQYLSTYLIDSSVALDAGSLGLLASPDAQAQIEHVFLSHAHIDHVATLPLFLEHAFRAGHPCTSVYASDATLSTLRDHLFNDAAWPDLERISADYPDTPLVRFHRLDPNVPVEAAGLRILPIPVDHAIPTLGFLVSSPGASILYSADTAPTDALWRAAASAPDLRAIFLEASFPDALAWLAERSKHLTPSQFASELSKLRALRPDADSIPVFAIHIKPKFADRVSRELLALNLPNVHLCEPGTTYRF